MKEGDLLKLLEDTRGELLKGNAKVGVLNISDIAVRILEDLESSGLLSNVIGLYSASAPSSLKEIHGVPIRSLPALKDDRPDVLVVAADEDKEAIIESALSHIQGVPKILVAGYGHYGFRDEIFEEILSNLLVPSLANGYKYSLIHIYQCLVNAARLKLEGAVAEFGVYKGGTTMFIATLIERLGAKWNVIGFDSFAGFPPRRSPLDMYDHPGCVFTDLAAVKHYLSRKNVELVVGDIAQTCKRLETEDLVLTFIDTDNYTPARAAITVVRERTVLNGAIVFDHFTGDDRFRYTLGERMAAKVLLGDERYFNLHGTGVFLRQR